MGMMLLDATPLITLAKAAGIEALNALTANGNVVTIADAVEREATAGTSPDAADIASWLQQNAGQINVMPTLTEGAYQDDLIDKYDVGDASITEILFDNRSSASPQDISVYSDDRYSATRSTFRRLHRALP